MPLTMHQASVPMFTQILSALSAVIDKAVAHHAKSGGDTAALIDMRLAPDMMTLGEQVRQACHHATLATARFANVDQPDFGDLAMSVDGLKARIAAALGFMAGLTSEQMEGSETRRAEIKIRIGPVAFKGQDLLLHFAIPQVLFHATTAYDLVRHAGVEVGKADFLGDVFTRKID